MELSDGFKNHERITNRTHSSKSTLLPKRKSLVNLENNQTMLPEIKDSYKQISSTKAPHRKASLISQDKSLILSNREESVKKSSEEKKNLSYQDAYKQERLRLLHRINLDNK